MRTAWLAAVVPVLVAMACSTPSTDSTPPVDQDAAGDAGESDAGSIEASPGDAAPKLKSEICKVSDSLLTDLLKPEAIFVRRNGTVVYIEMDDTPADTLRRYTVAATGPCTLVRDMSFGTHAYGPNYFGKPAFVDENEAVWSTTQTSIVRNSPGAGMPCTHESPASDELIDLVVDEQGTGGYAVTDTVWRKLTVTNEGCNLQPTVMTPEFIPIPADARSLAFDSLGRIHALHNPESGAEVRIHDRTGAHVKTYRPTASADDRIKAIARCGSGVCLGIEGNKGFDLHIAAADGTPIAKAPLTLWGDDLSRTLVMGASSTSPSKLFVLSSSRDNGHHEYVLRRFALE